MIDWTLELEDVACADNDMEKMDVLTFWDSKWERRGTRVEHDLVNP